jgi:SAM-dependent methyltransferase
MRVGELTAKALEKLRREGPINTLRVMMKSVVFGVSPEAYLRAKRWYVAYEDRRFDRRYGTDTAGLLEPWQLGPVDEVSRRAVKYEAAESHFVKSRLGELPIDYRDYVFLDVGSGKGRAALIASMFPFKRVVGIEYFDALHRIAERNRDIFRSKYHRCAEIELLCCDIRDYRLPEASLVLFLFNPFDETVLRRFLAQVEASLDAQPRDLFLIYYNPLAIDIFRECSSLIEWRGQTQHEGESYPHAIFRARRR